MNPKKRDRKSEKAGVNKFPAAVAPIPINSKGIINPTTKANVRGTILNRVAFVPCKSVSDIPVITAI
jgi:hypothetical protein